MKNEVLNAEGGTRRPPRYVPGLSAKLLLLTILFVMLAEVLVFVPSVSNFRRQWLMERLAAAQIASLAAEAAPGGQLPKMLRDELLEQAKVKAIAVKRADGRVEFPPTGDEPFAEADSIVVLGRRSNLDQLRRELQI